MIRKEIGFYEKCDKRPKKKFLLMYRKALMYGQVQGNVWSHILHIILMKE